MSVTITVKPIFRKGDVVRLLCDPKGPSYTVVGYVLAGEPLVTQYIICGYDGLEFTKYSYELIHINSVIE